MKNLKNFLSFQHQSSLQNAPRPYQRKPTLKPVLSDTARCNRIWAGQAAGIAVTEDGFGHVYFNDICGMEWGGIDIRNGGHPIIMNNTIHKGHGDGVVIGKRGCGLIFENVIRSKCRFH